jgi:dTDP-glucose pyrophosphorylase
MKIIILAAGRGQRFRIEGYDIPKPLILYKGKPFIEHAIEQCEGVPQEDIIVIGTPEVCSYLKGRGLPLITIPVWYTQRGPVMSALLAGGHVEDNESVVFVDCDTLIEGPRISHFAINIASGAVRTDCALLHTTIEGDTSKFCNIQFDSSSTKISILREKVPVSQHIAIGVYGFKKWSWFRGWAMSCALDETYSHCEIYFSLVLNLAIERKYQVHGAFIERKYWTTLGTPKDLPA